MGMKQSQTWVEALNINPEKLNLWSSLAPDGVPLLLYVLGEGHISCTQYLEWASARYNLPVLHESYFEAAFQSEVARNLQFTGGLEWKPWLFPIERWEDVTLVACIEPPSEPLGPEFRLVLADPLVLQKIWSQMANAFASTPFDAPALPDGPLEVPVGLTGTETKPFKLTLENLDDSNLFRTGFEAPPPAPSVAPEEPELTVTKSPPATPRAAPQPPAPAVAPTPTVPLIATVAPSGVPAVPPPPKKKPAKGKGSLLSPEQQNEQIELVFGQLKAIYRHVFIMKCQEGVSHLFKWDSSMTPAGAGENIHVDLTSPTFLRIIFKTLLPYHGYLVDSPAHVDFFSRLNLKELPGCVTALPLKDSNNLVGVLVAVGDETLQKLDTLHKAETAAENLIAALVPTWAKTAA